MKHPVHPDAMAREENIFKAAVQLADPAKRSACLDQACEGDTALRARIERLLAVANDTFFDTPPAPGPLPASEGWSHRGTGHLSPMDHPNIAKVFDAGATGEADPRIADFPVGERSAGGSDG